MKVLRWIGGVTKLDRIRNERISEIAKVGEISKKVQESSLKWYGNVLRREEACVGKSVIVIEVRWKRRSESPKRKFLYNIRNDLSERELSGDETQCRINCMEASHKKHRHHIKWERKEDSLCSLDNRACIPSTVSAL